MMKKILTLTLAISLISSSVSAFNVTDTANTIFNFAYDKKFAAGFATCAAIVALAKYYDCPLFNSPDYNVRKKTKNKKNNESRTNTEIIS